MLMLFELLAILLMKRILFQYYADYVIHYTQ